MSLNKVSVKIDIKQELLEKAIDYLKSLDIEKVQEVQFEANTSYDEMLMDVRVSIEVMR